MGKAKQKHWYKIYIHLCPACGHEDEFRERQYTRKPKNDIDRYEITPLHCGCLNRI